MLLSDSFISEYLVPGTTIISFGTLKYWLIIGGIFSANGTIGILGMALFAVAMYRKGEKASNKIALMWTLGTAMHSFVEQDYWD